MLCCETIRYVKVIGKTALLGLRTLPPLLLIIIIRKIALAFIIKIIEPDPARTCLGLHLIKGYYNVFICIISFRNKHGLVGS